LPWDALWINLDMMRNKRVKFWMISCCFSCRNLTLSLVHCCKSVSDFQWNQCQISCVVFCCRDKHIEPSLLKI
jgi:hypothetical protein